MTSHNKTSLEHVKLALHSPKPKESCRRVSQISDYAPVAVAEQEWSGHSCKWHITEPTNMENYQVFFDFVLLFGKLVCDRRPWRASRRSILR